MFRKVKEVSPLPGMRLSVIFANGATKVYDVVPLLSRFDAFKVLQDPNVFGSVEVDVGGYGIVWNDDIDLSCDELWENGAVEETPFDGLISFADATELWGNGSSPRPPCGANTVPPSLSKPRLVVLPINVPSQARRSPRLSWRRRRSPCPCCSRT